MRPLSPLRVKKPVEAQVKAGMPWVYASDIVYSSELDLLPGGSLVSIENARGEFLGIGYYNGASQIACRVLSLKNEAIDAAWFEKRIGRALGIREKAVGVPYYRLVHSEGDFLPGLLLDRFGDVLVAQCGTAGMEMLMPHWLSAVEKLLAPKAIVLRNDAGTRAKEGLALESTVIKGDISGLVELQENGCWYFADVLKGQKTGWFFDQRENRAMMAQLSRGKRVVDIYSHSGGFGVLAAKAGAEAVTLVDSSGLALELAQATASKNGVSVACMQGDAFAVMEKLFEAGERFDVVLADPPAFVKSKKDIAAGLKGYEKVVRMAAKLCVPGGVLFTASCSHYAGRGAFEKAVVAGAKASGFSPRIAQRTGAGVDHPVHAMLPAKSRISGRPVRGLERPGA
ncbi:MAG: class I SAM-dependent rRNA methyltransferase, partial [Rickettsiales bacterium]|nr:class I SAM-dependent rRNA methyltransferase [Rickettsiales bacterium]